MPPRLFFPCLAILSHLPYVFMYQQYLIPLINLYHQTCLVRPFCASPRTTFGAVDPPQGGALIYIFCLGKRAAGLGETVTSRAKTQERQVGSAADRVVRRRGFEPQSNAICPFLVLGDPDPPGVPLR